MDNSAITASSNWTHMGGCSLSQCIQQRAADPDIFIKPHLSELVDEKRSILLSKENSSEHCEFYVKIFPNFKIQAVSLVCNAIRIEIFQGAIKEYLETIYGDLVDEKDDQFKTYRYDVETEKSGITDLTLRFLTSSSDICIFGVMLHKAPNPNGITTLLPSNRSINGQNILENSTKKSDAEADLVKKANPYNKTKQKICIPIEVCSTECSGTAMEAKTEMFDSLKFHIDERFKQIELQIGRHLEAMEQRQAEKLDRILNILEKNK